MDHDKLIEESAQMTLEGTDKQKALLDMASLDTLKLCVLNFVYDLRDNEPSAGDDFNSGGYFKDGGGSVYPYITVYPDHAIFSGANF